jgi:hypothetical protein
MTHQKCGCRLMTVEECLLERGHFSPKEQDYGIKYCPMHAAAPKLLDVAREIVEAADDPDNDRARDLVDAIPWEKLREVVAETEEVK